MPKIIATEWITLDGVFDANTMQKWQAPYDSPQRQKFIQNNILSADGFLLGRTTYEMLAPYWSAMKNNEMGVADKLNNAPKYVVSTTLKKGDWNNSTVIRDNVLGKIRELKAKPGDGILIMGSATLVQSLADANLIDEYRFLVHPIVMGSGARFFREGMGETKLKLVKSEALNLGVMSLIFEPAKPL
jgi:dihydrofolate reductase